MYLLFIFIFLSTLSTIHGEIPQELDSRIKQHLETFEVPGASVGLILNDKVLFSKGYGKCAINSDQPVTEETRFPIGSCTKAFTSFLLGILVDEGKLNWDDRVITHLPEFKLYTPDLTNTVTVKDLLAHRTGIPRHDLIWEIRHLSYDSIIELLPFLKPVVTIRETFLYNNFMYVVAEKLIEKITYKTWKEFLQERILNPLNLHKTTPSLASTKQASALAFPHEVRFGKLQMIPFRDITDIAPAGSINSSCKDMLQWLSLQMQNGVYNDKRIITEATIQDMHTVWMHSGFYPDTESVPVGYGLGWEISRYRNLYNIQHNGSIDGFDALVSFLPNEKIGVVVLTNTRPNGGRFADVVSRELFDYFLHTTRTDWTESIHKEEVEEHVSSPKKSALIRSLTEYTGNYSHPAYGNVSIEVNNTKDGLIANFNIVKTPLEHCSYDIFRESPKATDPVFEGKKFIFETGFDGSIDAITAKLEPLSNPIVFTRKTEDLFLKNEYLNKFLGKYESESMEVSIVLKDKHLLLLSDGKEYILQAEDNNRFDGDGIKVRFSLDLEKRISHVFIEQNQIINSFIKS